MLRNTVLGVALGSVMLVAASSSVARTLTRAATAHPEAAYQDVLSQLAANQSPLDLLRLTLGYWPD